MANKLKLKMNNTNFSEFIDMIKDLSNIDDIVKIRITNEDILMYSILSNETTVLALKSYTVPTTKFITDFNSNEIYDMIILSSSKFVKNTRLFNTQQPITIDLTAKKSNDKSSDIMHIRSFQLTNGKLKIQSIGGEEFKIRNINKEQLNSRLDIRKSKWSFSISQSDFSDIKSLCNINKEANEDKIVYISVNNKQVIINEPTKWELQVDEVDFENTNILMNKNYLPNITVAKQNINFNIFDTFILIKDDISNLMLSFEQDFN